MAEIKGNLSLLDVTFQTNRFFPVPDEYVAFGDSFTVGDGASPGAGFVDLLTTFYSLPLTNLGHSGRGAYAAIESANAAINPGDAPLVTAMFGLNDLRRGGANAKTQAKIINAYQCLFANQYLSSYIGGGVSDSSLNRVGSWSGYTANSVGGKSASGAFTITLNDYVEYTFTNNNVVVAGIGGDGVAQIFADLEIFIDGVSQGTFTENNQTDGISDATNNNQRSPICWIFSGLTFDQHTVKVVCTTTGKTLVVDYFGHLLDPSQGYPLVIYKVPRLATAGYAVSPANANDTIINNFNTAFTTAVGTYPANYPVFFIDTPAYYSPPTGTSGDNIHPNNAGHAALAQGAEDALPDISVFPPDNTLYSNTDLYYVKSSLGRRLAYADELSGNTFSTGLTDTFNVITNNLSTGVASSNQDVIGSTSASGTLTLKSTSSGTKGKIFGGVLTIDEANGFIGINNVSPASTMLDIICSASGNLGILVKGATSQSADPLRINNSSDTPVFRCTATGGMQVLGALTGPTGSGGFELEYNSGTAFVTAYNRNGATAVPMTIRASTIEMVTGTGLSAVAVDISSSGLVINENSAAFNFRVESDGNANMINLDGTNNRVGIGRAPTTDVFEVDGNISLTTAGNKLKIATGSNASVGVSGAMTAGSITISTTAVTSSSKIFLTHASTGGTTGVLTVGTIVNATSFVINSSNGGDTGTVNWLIIN